MVNHNSGLGLNGAYEWLLVRASAIIIFSYIIYLLVFICMIDTITYEVWRSFFANFITKFFTMLTLLSMLVHTWLGMWQILTDYIKPLLLYLVSHLTIVIVLMVYFIYGTLVIWRT